MHESHVSPDHGTGVQWRTLLSGDRVSSAELTLGVADVPPGESDPVRHHHPPAEAYYILEGEGVLEIDGQTYEVRQGHAAFIPGGSVHRLTNTGSVMLRLLYVFPVDSFEDVEYTFLDG